MKHAIGDIFLPDRPVRWLGIALIITGLVFPFAVVAIRAKRWQPPPPEAPVTLRPELVILLGGTFQMGSSPDDEPDRDDDEALHTVTISPFVVARTEVTQQQFGAVGASSVGDGCEEAGIGDDLPVVCVSWLDAVRYCNALSEAERLEPVYTIGDDAATWNREANGYRLPTEAEWEYAARANTRTRWVGTNIENEVCDFANVADRSARANNPGRSTFDCDDSSPTLAPVADRRPNRWQIFGFGGNAAEWVWDPYQADLTQLEPDNPIATNAGLRVIRGGSWGGVPRFARVASRFRSVPSNRSGNLGFRVARSVLPSEVLPSEVLPSDPLP